MLTALKKQIQKFGGVGHERTLNVKINIFYSFLIKGASVLAGFVLVPLTIHFINPVQYGIWLTIYAIIAWINTFDIGLSNGLRNQLAKAVALNEKENVVKYISTTYVLLFIIAAAIFVLFFLAGSFFNWNQLLKIPNSIDYNVWPIILIALGLFCVQFILQPINSILIATHQPFKSSLIFLVGQLLSLLIIYLLTLYSDGSLFILVIVAAGAPVFSLLTGSLYFFATSLKSFKPRFNLADLKSSKSLLNLGSAFFFIQIGALVLYETDNIIITRVLGPAEVTTFNIGFKYFSILAIAFNIIITPYWSAFTDAYAKHDFAWIRHSVKKLRTIWLFVSISAFLLYLLANTFYSWWVGAELIIPTSLSLSLAVYIVVQNWMVIHTYLLNGTGKIKLQLILVIGSGILNIPVSIFLIHRMGIAGTVVANIAVMLIMSIFLTYQSKLVIDRKATGIWSK